MSEITLVTAYFNIGRENWTGFSRGDDKYLKYFAHWARMKNKLIVYTSPSMITPILDIRKHFGLEDQTTVIPIEDVTACVPDAYTSIKNAMSHKDSWLFHKKLDHPESWNALYNYVTGIKSFFVQDAIQKELAHGNIAWIDFGYDHGGEEFPYSEDFDFLWTYDFEPKIHLFLAQELDDSPIFKIVQAMTTYIRGGIIVAPDFLWNSFWQDSYQAILSLASCGLADDDQTITLMAYRQQPDYFQTHMTNYWGEPLRAYGGEHIRLRPQKYKHPKLWRKRIKQYLHYQKEKWDIHHRHGTEIEKKLFTK